MPNNNNHTQDTTRLANKKIERAKIYIPNTKAIISSFFITIIIILITSIIFYFVNLASTFIIKELLSTILT